jgi:hypothetical protein
MASLSRSKAVLELGKRLVEQLGDGDLLSAWMAHNIAELMRAVDAAAPEAKSAAQAECAAAILDFWKHREAIPSRVRPLRELEPVLRVLSSLDLDSSDYRYYPAALRAAKGVDVPEETMRWLTLATSVDYMARLLIRDALRSAAEPFAADAAPWISLAQGAGAEAGAEASLVRFVLADEGGPEDTPDVASLKDKLQRLESFSDLAKIMAAEIRLQLARATTQEEPSL